MNYDENAMPRGASNEQKPRLVVRMVWVRYRDRERVRERGACFVERDPVFPSIRRRLSGISRKAHSRRRNLPPQPRPLQANNASEFSCAARMPHELMLVRDDGARKQ